MAKQPAKIVNVRGQPERTMAPLDSDPMTLVGPYIEQNAGSLHYARSALAALYETKNKTHELARQDLDLRKLAAPAKPKADDALRLADTNIAKLRSIQATLHKTIMEKTRPMPNDPHGGGGAER